jgi:endogenous inhibitor of DNA gyrase (YacG/DUF329 family)
MEKPDDKTEVKTEEDEYANHTRCPLCRKQTNGIEDYQNIRTKSITKSCAKCRKSVYASYKKNVRPKKQTITMKQQLVFLHILILELNNIDELIVKYPEYTDVIQSLQIKPVLIVEDK